MSREISLIIPVYNVEQYIGRCISSCLEQEFSGSFEIIVVDDCGKDNSIALVEEFNDSRIKIVAHEKNKGLSAARNTGLAAATGQYVLFLDSDDFIELSLLEICIHKIKASDVDFVTFNSVKVDESGKLIKNYWMSRYAGKSLSALTIADEEAKTLVCWDVAAWCKLIKRDFLLSNNIWFDEEQRWFEDHLFSAQLFSLGKFTYIDEVLHYYFQRSDAVAQKSITQEKGAEVSYFRARAILSVSNWLLRSGRSSYFRIFLPLFLDQYKLILIHASSDSDIFIQVYGMLREAFSSYQLEFFQQYVFLKIDFIYILVNYDYQKFSEEISEFSRVDRDLLLSLVPQQYAGQLKNYINVLSILPDINSKKKVLSSLPKFLFWGGYRFIVTPKQFALRLRDFYVLDSTDVFNIDDYNHHAGTNFIEREKAILHYLFVGRMKHYSPLNGFSSLGYLEHNPDLSLINMSLFVHFILYAKLEGRKC